MKPISTKMSFTMKLIFSYAKQIQDKRRTAAGVPLHRTESASLHSDGGAFHDVTHGQRKYHYLRV